MTIVTPTPARIELGKLIGQGANGCVYSGWRSDAEQTIRQPVAIKILNSKNQVEIWRDEFTSLMQINSPRCVRVYGFEWLDGKPALILELVEGVNLTELYEFGSLGKHELIFLLNEIFLALEDLRSHGLCHGDLSAANVLIDRCGKVRLVDFGFGNSAAGRRQITPEFAAPEVLKGGVPTHSSDLWSLGILAQAFCPQHLKEEFVAALTCLLQEDPAKRTWAAITDDYPRIAQNNLAEIVEEILRKRQLFDGKTRSLDDTQKSRFGNFGPRWIHAAAGLAIVFNLAARGSAGAVETPVPTPGGDISVRSNFGVEISLNGQVKGYAPIDFFDLTKGEHEVTWLGPNGNGHVTLTLQPGQHIVIDDRVLMNQ